MDAWAMRYGGESAAKYATEGAKATSYQAVGKMMSGFSGSSLTAKYAPGDAYQPSESYYGNYPR